MGDYSTAERSEPDIQQRRDTTKPNAVAVQGRNEEMTATSAETEPNTEWKDSAPGSEHPPAPSPSASAALSEPGADDASSVGTAPSAFSTGLNVCKRLGILIRRPGLTC